MRAFNIPQLRLQEDIFRNNFADVRWYGGNLAPLRIAEFKSELIEGRTFVDTKQTTRELDCINM
ncbi:hypothetical protein PPSC2_20860 [Paenibacillus polymyxa SC2]|uniref:Uncharacterized protein n=1 Tax=Paenibacillus polymyxa (strain SC2) TaxID=886882 RepID=A0A0D5ZCK1_PAEPS|nr:hypothetical protein PPSC2_20860 [Paenibacillus polymyxa SC2]